MSYGSEDGMNAIFGAVNIQEWADPDNTKNEVAIAARIVYVLRRATTYIDARLHGGPYAVPFTSPYPDLIADACDELAGSMLYDARRITDYNEDADPGVDVHRKSAEGTLRALHAGTLRILSLTSATNYPAVAADET